MNAFGSVPGDPNWNPDADLDGDDEVTLFDFGILTANFGLIGAEEFAGSTQSASGVFTATVHVVLGDWTAQTDRAVYVVLQLKRAGTEGDSGTPIYEQSVTFTQGEVEKDVQVHLAAGIYTVRALAYNDEAHTDISHWLRSELTGLVVPSGGGAPASHVPAPSWAEDVIPSDTIPAVGLGGGPSRAHQVNLASGVYEHVPEPDLVASNPVGPEVRFARFYSTYLARQGYASPGLPVGWTHSYDLRLEGNLSGLTLRYPNGATETLTPQQISGQWILVPPPGAPYRGIGARNDAQGRWDRVRIHFQDGSAWEFEYLSGNQYRLRRVYGRGTSYADINQPPPNSGLFIRLDYDAQGRLSAVVNGLGVTLLSLNYSGSYLQSAVTRDQNGAPYATVTYTIQSVGGVPCLTRVSQVNNTAASLWEYGYEVYMGVPYLRTVKVPHPSGTGMANSELLYDANGVLVLLTDGNGNVRTYQYQGGQTKVETYRSTGQRDFIWTQTIGASNVSAGIRDASSAQSSLVYEHVYRPVQYTNRNGQTFAMTRDIFGNPLTITTPRGIRWTFTYDYPATYPVEPIVSMSVNQIGHDGSTRTPTVYEFYTFTDPAQGAVKGLLAQVLSPMPGTVNSGQQVETRFYYTALGNVALISAPGPNNDGRRLSTLFFYTVDPWTGATFPEAQNQPVAVAVYDKTLTLADYNAIPSNPTLRDDRLIFFERYRYDARGNLTQVIDAAGYTTELQYNGADQLEWINYPWDTLNGVQARDRLLYRYVGGPLVGMQVYNGATLFRSYPLGAGAEGEARAMDAGSVRKADLGYDSNYRLLGIMGGLNASTGRRHTTQYTYTDQNFVQDTIYPNNDTYTFSQHDNEGNPLQRMDAQGLITTFVRSATDSRIEQVQYPDNTGNIAVEYDGFNRVRKLTRNPSDPANRIVVEYTYDDNDLPLTVTTTYPAPVGARTVSYSYYPDGSRATMTVVNQTFQYSYTYITGVLDVSGEPFAGLQVRVRLPVQQSFNLDTWYDRRGLLRRERNSGTVLREYHYNGRGLLTHLYNRNAVSPGTIYADFSNLVYDAAGNPVAMSVNIPGQDTVPPLQGTVSYDFDDQDRQTDEQFDLGWTPLNGRTLLYSYDANDNLLASEDNSAPPVNSRDAIFASNAADQIGNTGWTYLNGDAVQMVRFGESGIVMGYNREHQLVYFYNPNPPAVEIFYRYRPDGLLAARFGGNYNRWYLYDGDRIVAELDAANGNLRLLYGYSSDGLTQRFEPGGANRRFYTFDPFGSVIHRILSPNNVLSTAWHDRFGWVYLDESVSGSGVYPTPDVLDGYLGRFGLFRDPDTRGFRQIGVPSWQKSVTPLNMSVFGAVLDPATLRTTSRTGSSQNPYTRLYRPEKNFADANWNLVVAFANWGYTVGDPSASESERFLAGLSALGRLLAVGSEWGSYAAPVSGSGARAGGSVARTALREAAEEAGEKLARQGVRQAARELERKAVGSAAASSVRAIVIGENMSRVRAAAKALGASYYRAWRMIPFDSSLALRRNEAWIRRKVQQGYKVLDIGIDLARQERSPFYAMERRVLQELGVEPVPVYWPASDNLRFATGH
ncbi:MAG: hypothetical protein KatS3mg022_2791 [Armatimonadota bacterium]|nr:MAG: hypothetical protein KatS3mg022_2791 [Armatimonadota bacterium]